MKIYIEKLVSVLEEMDLKEIERLISFMKGVPMIWVIGNGGSNAAASHLAEDLIKLVGKPAMAISDSPLVTMAGNDEGIENMFLFPLKKLVGEDDLIIGMTMGGQSKNVLDVMINKDLKCKKFLITGLGGKYAGVNKLVIPSNDIQICEDVCLSIVHLVCRFWGGVQ